MHFSVLMLMLKPHPIFDDFLLIFVFRGAAVLVYALQERYLYVPSWGPSTERHS